MGILEKAYETYDNLSNLVGKIEENKTPLSPISHIIANAHIEITIDINGNFINATTTEKGDKQESKKNQATIIPVTESSAGRSSGISAHALSDNLSYLSTLNVDRYVAYRNQLEEWVNSAHSHKKAEAVLCYIKKETILRDLQRLEIIKCDETGKYTKDKILGTDYEKCVVRWIVIGGDDNFKDACYGDESLFQSYIEYYNSVILTNNKQELCMIKGEILPVTTNHPKGIISASYGAKLVVASDINSISYEVSQKAHNALKYIISNSGISLGEMSFVWWNTANKSLPAFDTVDDFGDDINPINNYALTDYKKCILDTFSGYRNEFEPTDNIVIATFEAATTGRLSLTYYNEFKADDFFNRIEKWYNSIAFVNRKKIAPKLKEIVRYAYGVDTGSFIEIHNKKLFSERMKSLLNCMVNGQQLPLNIVRALVVNASAPQKYSAGNYERVLYTACAVLKKYYNDKYQKEVYGMGLDEENKNRSYLFGRLLAICDKVEKSTYLSGEGRETNAMRIQSTFANRPMTSFRILENQLTSYYNKLNIGLAEYFKKMITEIFSNIDVNDASLNKPLEDIYILGYYHQREVLNKKKDNTENTDNVENTKEEQ